MYNFVFLCMYNSPTSPTSPFVYIHAFISVFVNVHLPHFCLRTYTTSSVCVCTTPLLLPLRKYNSLISVSFYMYISLTSTFVCTYTRTASYIFLCSPPAPGPLLAYRIKLPLVGCRPVKRVLSQVRTEVFVWV